MPQGLDDWTQLAPWEKLVMDNFKETNETFKCHFSDTLKYRFSSIQGNLQKPYTWYNRQDSRLTGIGICAYTNL